jgi:ferric-dicitrate binding protein FerR (iron transport regulator)
MELKVPIEQIAERAHQIAEHAASTKRGRRALKDVDKLERKLEKIAKRLPVDTPLDRRRRQRTKKRGMKAGTMLVITAGGAAAYLVYKSRSNNGEATPEASWYAAGDGEAREQATTTADERAAAHRKSTGDA